jgi:sugar fermentation stimulation protein A
MQLPPLTRGRILSRYKRFFADVALDDGSVITAHCPNTGRMTGCWQPDAPAEISFSDNPKRKLPWTLERVDMGQGWVGVNTARTNAVVAESLEAGWIPPLAGYPQIRREVKFDIPGHNGSSRLDFMLAGAEQPDVLIEVKNVTLWEAGCLRFPDAVSVRARKHLDGLLWAVEQGMRGVILFALNRSEGECFAPADGIDPLYARRLAEVIERGVEAYALRINHTDDGMLARGLVPVRP